MCLYKLCTTTLNMLQIIYTWYTYLCVYIIILKSDRIWDRDHGNAMLGLIRKKKSAWLHSPWFYSFPI